jgi:hypothetical protein
MKSRSSTGVGMKIDLEYNIETMRISDEGGEDVDSGNSYRPQPSPSDLMNKLKTQTTIVGGNEVELPEENKRVIADVQGSKLKAMLNNLKK